MPSRFGRRAVLAATGAVPGTALALWMERFLLFQVETTEGRIVVGLTRDALAAFGPGTEHERMERALASADGLPAWRYEVVSGRYRAVGPVTLRREVVARFSIFPTARVVEPPPG